ncbi:MAG TPA: hypothetical protein VFZ65_06260 [Planctomycetota bacterium]|nr:hypothetical protein [Planctomycetota bacterium]
MNPTSSSVPSVRSLVVVPAAITLAVTALRLALELLGAPSWLANRDAGGPGALAGIVWLPFVFGPWFALRLRAHIASTRALLAPLARTLVVYGLLARLPVFLVTIVAVLGEWGTHYDAFPGQFGTAAKIGLGFAFQMGFWACIWTVVTGMLAGLLVVALRPRSKAAAA